MFSQHPLVLILMLMFNATDKNLDLGVGCISQFIDNRSSGYFNQTNL